MNFSTLAHRVLILPFPRRFYAKKEKRGGKSRPALFDILAHSTVRLPLTVEISSRFTPLP